MSAILKAPLASVRATYGVSAETQKPAIHGCTSHCTLIGHSGFSTLIWIFGLYFGCAWLADGFVWLVVWMLCRMPSLFWTSIVLPAGKSRMCGLNSQVFWSKSGFWAGTSSFLPLAAFTTTTTLAMPPPAPTSSSGFVFSLPQTSGSLVTEIFAGAGGAP